MELTSGRSPRGTLWYQRTAALPDDRWAVRAVMTDHYADGTVIGPDDVDPDVVARIGEDTVLWQADNDDEGRCRVVVSDWIAPGAPDAWFVLVTRDDDPGLAHEMVGMAAFVTHHLPDGTVVSAAEAADLGVHPRDRAAAMRWVRASGLVRHLQTEPEHRRQHLGIKLLAAGDGVIRYQGWGGKIHGDGVRTEEGERLAMSLQMPSRVPTWTTNARIGGSDRVSPD